jgi:hypothetical protein
MNSRRINNIYNILTPTNALSEKVSIAASIPLMTDKAYFV